MVQSLELDDSQQQASREKQEAESRKFAEDLRWIMSDKRGRRYMWRLLEQTRVYQLSLVLGAFDQTAFNEGQRSIGLKYLAELDRVCPERYEEMVKENTK
jgi:hypothetical protein